jgi:hypothetical protein
MKSVPHAKIKSAPRTDMMAAGKPYCQNGALGTIMANRRAERPVAVVPIAIQKES